MIITIIKNQQVQFYYCAKLQNIRQLITITTIFVVKMTKLIKINQFYNLSTIFLVEAIIAKKK